MNKTIETAVEIVRDPNKRKQAGLTVMALISLWICSTGFFDVISGRIWDGEDAVANKFRTCQALGDEACAEDSKRLTGGSVRQQEQSTGAWEFQTPVPQATVPPASQTLERTDKPDTDIKSLRGPDEDPIKKQTVVPKPNKKGK